MELTPKAVAILNSGNQRWHLGARFADGPLLSAEACNLDDATPDDLVEYDPDQLPVDADLCERCVVPVVAVR